MTRCQYGGHRLLVIVPVLKLMLNYAGGSHCLCNVASIQAHAQEKKAIPFNLLEFIACRDTILVLHWFKRTSGCV